MGHRDLTEEEMRDEYIAARQLEHIGRMSLELAKGDAALVSRVDDALGVKLSTTEAWAELIAATARGENRMDQLICECISQFAEIEAIKDAERAERARLESIADHLIDITRERLAYQMNRPLH